MRLRVLKRLIFAFFLFLALALVYNQIFKGAYYLRLSQDNRIKLIRLAPSRGLIYDRRREIIAGTRLMFNAAILPQEVEDIQQALAKVSPIVEISKDKLSRQYKRNFFTPFLPVVVAHDIPKETAIALECREDEIPGLVIQTESLRDYPQGENAGHILGYLGSVREEELGPLQAYGLRIRDLVGRGGLEEEFDYYLRGQPGGMQVEVNNRGHKVGVLGKRPPLKGGDIQLTIDMQLQNFVSGLLKDKKGSCIVLNPQNGEILTMVSKPGFDPNLFIAALNGKSQASQKIEKLLHSREAPLLNRAISGVYPPGSIFKIAVAAAALETGKITPRTQFNCTGSFNVGNREFLCWNLDGHGSQDIYSGLAHSCNVFFYNLGLALGPDEISFFARKFGLGSPTGVDLPYESAGLVPSKSWKLKTHKERWYDGETANFSIGQGYLLTTPLQMARLVAVVANGGYLVKPHLVKKAGKGSLSFSRQNLDLNKETLGVIKEGMRQVVQNEGGTGHNARIGGVQWAAKTGTAQTARWASHGWFAGFYPLQEPQVLVLVFLEYGGSGGQVPAMIAKKIIEYIRKNNLNVK